ncbi:MAG: aminopeptidase [Actinobacteria bacterium]|nr:MAG: aminopeptidase [Actinomycetota bacterium]
MTPEERLERYADLAVRVGANVQPGQDVVVFVAQVEHAPVIRAIARAAYKVGARGVEVRYGDHHVRRAAIEFGPEDQLGWTPPREVEWIRSWASTRPAVFQLTGTPSPICWTGSTRRSSREPISARLARRGWRSWPTAGSTGRSSPRRTRAGRERSSASPTSNASGRRSRRRRASTSPIRWPRGKTMSARSSAAPHP